MAKYRLILLQRLFLVYCGFVLSETLGSTTTSSTHQTSPSTSPSMTTTTTTDQTSPATSPSMTTTTSTVDTPMATTARDLVCYGCADTERGGDCQSNSKVMLREAQAHLAKSSSEQNDQSGTNYVKRCSSDNLTYCVIETIENRGEVHSYIRDCSDGRSFSYGASKLQLTRPDNQTTCAYTLQGYLICVKLCQTSFCNGPIAHQTSSACSLSCTLSSIVLLVLCLILRN